MPQAHLHPQFWQAPVLLTSALVLLAAIYSWGWVRLRSTFPDRAPVWRLATPIAGLSLVWIIVGSPLSALDHYLLTIHMVNHLVLMLAVPPLVLTAAAVQLKLWQTPLFTHGPPARRLSSFVGHPVFCWLCATATVIGWHLPAAFLLAMHTSWWHNVEYASFTLSGLLFWWPVLRPASSAPSWPAWSIPLYLFAATLPCDILSAFLAFSDRVVYPAYLSAPRLLHLSPLQDQQGAAALMWTSVTFAYSLPAVVITVKMLSPREVRSHRQESGGPGLH